MHDQQHPATTPYDDEDEDAIVPPDGFELPPVVRAAPADERIGHADYLRNLRSLRDQADARARAARPPVFNLEDEARRLDAAKARAFAGREHYTYFPRLACQICGGVPWLDDEKQRVRENHLAEPHGYRARAHYDEPTRRGPRHFSRVSFNVDEADEAHDRARRSTGER